jgi:transposase
LNLLFNRRLATQHEKLAGIYAGNPKRSTARPTAEALLEAFKEITLTVITMGGQIQRHLTPLSNVQQQILALLDFRFNIYTRLAANSRVPT